MRIRFLAPLFMLVMFVTLGEPVQGRSAESPLALTRLGTGAIVGRVRVEGPVERPGPLTVYKNRQSCGSTVEDESILVSNDGTVENVVVIIKGGEGGVEKKSHTVILDNKDCKFAPHVQVVSVGSEVLLRNSDPILHDVHARLDSKTLFNVGLPSWRQVKKKLAVPGVITIGCEVLHTWMSAFIVVTSSRYFAITDSAGQFTLEGVPPGKYKLEFWHEKLGRMSREAVVQSGRIGRIDAVFASPGNRAKGP